MTNDNSQVAKPLPCFGCGGVCAIDSGGDTLTRLRCSVSGPVKANSRPAHALDAPAPWPNPSGGRSPAVSNPIQTRPALSRYLSRLACTKQNTMSTIARVRLIAHRSPTMRPTLSSARPLTASDNLPHTGRFFPLPEAGPSLAALIREKQRHDAIVHGPELGTLGSDPRTWNAPYFSCGDNYARSKWRRTRASAAAR
jgi:hypothetical protein